MDNIPLPPSEPSYSPSQVTGSSPEEKTPVLSKDRAKKRLLAFSKAGGVSFGLKSRTNPVANKEFEPLNDDDDEEAGTSICPTPTTMTTLAPGTSVGGSYSAVPTKKLNIDSIIEEEKEELARKSGLLTFSNVLSVPSTVVPVEKPPSSTIIESSLKRQEERSSRRFSSRKEEGRSRQQNKYAGIDKLPTDWKSFSQKGLDVSDPDFPRFKRQIDRHNGDASTIENKKRNGFSIVKRGESLCWREYMKDPVASDSELAFRGLNVKKVETYGHEEGESLIWTLHGDYHSKEYPRKAEKETRTRPILTYSENPKLYKREYLGRFSFEKDTHFSLVFKSLVIKENQLKKLKNDKFTSDSFISKEREVPICEHRSWYVRTENFASDKSTKETTFTEVLIARKDTNFFPSTSCRRNIEFILFEGHPLEDGEVEDSNISRNIAQEIDEKEIQNTDVQEFIKEETPKAEDEPLKEEDFPLKVSTSKKSKKNKKKSKRCHDDVEDNRIKKKKKKKDAIKLPENIIEEPEGDEENDNVQAEEEEYSPKKSKKTKKKHKSEDDKFGSSKKKKKKKKRKKSSKDEEEEEEEDSSFTKKKKKKKDKKAKKSKKVYAARDQSSPLLDEENPADKSVSLCNIGTWEDPMSLTHIKLSSQQEDDGRSPSPPPASTTSSQKDPRARSLYAMAGYGGASAGDEKKRSGGGPRTPSPANRGPRTPSPKKEKSSWRPPSPRQSPPPSNGASSPSRHRRRRGRSRSRSFDRSSSGGSSSRLRRSSRSPMHRHSRIHHRSSRSPRSGRIHHHHRSPSPLRRFSGQDHQQPSYHLERSVADSTISDADLPGFPTALRQTLPPFSYEDYHLPQGNSPKRLSLDERLEKELGINVREEGQRLVPPPPQDFSKPPPGYLPRASPLVPQHPPPPIVPIRPGEVLPPPILAPPNVPPPPFPLKDTPEEGRLVRIGNMLQIVPEPPSRPQPIMVPPPDNHVAAATAAAAAAAAAVTAALQNPPEPKEAANTAMSLMRKMEEMKKQKERERNIRREQRLAEKLERQLAERVNTADTEFTLPENEEEDQENAKEAKILQEAISSVPELDEEAITGSPPSPSQTTSKSTHSKDRRNKKIHYISLKPFSKKERKRQKLAVTQISTSSNFAEEDEGEDEEWVPRSPVPLPDASTCKPILMHVGFSDREKKVLRYADGILPGQGSPDHQEEQSPSCNASTDQSATKRRKKVRLRVCSQKSEETSSPPPPPPSGSPPLWHYKQWLSGQIVLSN